LIWKCGLSAVIIGLTLLLYNRQRVAAVRANLLPVVFYLALIFVIAGNCSNLITSRKSLMLKRRIMHGTRTDWKNQIDADDIQGCNAEVFLKHTVILW